MPEITIEFSINVKSNDSTHLDNIELTLFKNFKLVEGSLKMFVISEHKNQKRTRIQRVKNPVEPVETTKLEITKYCFSRYGFHHPVLHQKFLTLDTKKFYKTPNYYFCYVIKDKVAVEVKFWFVSTRIGTTYKSSQFTLAYSEELDNV